MQRNILTTIKFEKKWISVNCIEKLHGNFVEIYFDSLKTNDGLKQTEFIKRSIAKIENLINGKITSVVAIVGDYESTALEIKVLEKGINLLGSYVSQDDVNNVIKLLKNNLSVKEKVITTVQPIEYEVQGETNKLYKQAPINKKGKVLKVKAAVSMISEKVDNYINQVISHAGLKVSQKLTSSQTLSHQKLSGNAIQDGTILINFGMNKIILSICTNNAILKIETIPIGFNKLIYKVSEIFGCKPEDAFKLIRIHGKVSGDEDVIYTTTNGLKDIKYKSKHLSMIICQFIKKGLRYSQEFISRFKSLSNLSVVLSGEIEYFENLEHFSKQYLSTDYVSIHKPLTFIDSIKEHEETIGAMHFIERFDKTTGKNFDTIIQTNPKKISTLKTQKSLRKLNYILGWIGGKYARTN